MGMLFAAHHTQPQQSHDDGALQPTIEADTNLTNQAAGQSSLHRFWNISSVPNSTALPMVTEMPPAACEDCGAGLGDRDGMDIDGGDAVGCVACGKKVCFSCSVSNLGQEKRCLACAGTRGGSSGWRDGVVVF